MRASLFLIGFIFSTARIAMAQDPSLVLDPIAFQNRQLTITYTTNPQVQFTGCDLKIRAAAKQATLQSTGLGQLVYNATSVSSDQFYAGLSSITTDQIGKKPKGGIAYFRIYLTCSDFVIQSNIQSVSFASSAIRNKVKFVRWVEHLKARIDVF